MRKHLSYVVQDVANMRHDFGYLLTVVLSSNIFRML